MKKIGPKPIISCKYCGKQFFQSMSTVKYCSDDCRETAQRERDKLKKSIQICLRCNKPFETKRYSSRWYCDECKRRGKEQDKPSPRKNNRERELRKAEKMRKIKESGLTYGQYTAGIRNTEPAEYEGTVMHDQWTNRWDEIKPAEERIVPHPRATLKIHPSMLPLPPAAGRYSADQDKKELDNAKEEKNKEEAKAEGTGHDMHEMLQAQ